MSNNSNGVYLDTHKKKGKRIKMIQIIKPFLPKESYDQLYPEKWKKKQKIAH